MVSDSYKQNGGLAVLGPGTDFTAGADGVNPGLLTLWAGTFDDLGGDVTANTGSVTSAAVVVSGGGLLSLENTLTVSGPDFDLAGGTVSASNGVTVGPSGAVAGFGAINADVSMQGLVAATGGTLHVTGEYSQNGGTATGSGVLDAQDINWTGGTMNGSGTTTADAWISIAGPVTLGGRTVQTGIAGNTWAGAILGGGGTLVNRGTLSGWGTLNGDLVDNGSLYPEQIGSNGNSTMTVKGTYTENGTLWYLMGNDASTTSLVQAKYIKLNGTLDYYNTGSGYSYWSSGYTVVQNIGSAPVQGRFVNYAAGSVVVGPPAYQNGYNMDYMGGSGHDNVTLDPFGATSSSPGLVVNAFSGATEQGQQLTMDVLAYDGSAPGTQMTITGFTTPGHGNASVSSGKISYTPSPTFYGTDTLTYTVSDGAGDSASAAINVTILRAPTAVVQTISTGFNTGIAVNVLANDTCDSSTTLSVASICTPAQGSAFLNADGTVTYIPAVGFVGPDSFSYTVSDGEGGTASNTAYVTVDAAPTANDVNAVTEIGSQVSVNVTSGTLTVSAVDQPSNGSASISTDGKSVTYLPNAGFSGQDSFAYTIADGLGGYATAEVYVTVGPTASDIQGSTMPGNPVMISVAGSVTSPSSFSVSAVGLAGAGTVTYSGQNVIYAPNPGFVGTDSFAYTITDQAGNTSTANVEVVVGTTANDVGVVTAVETPVSIDVVDSVTAPANATITVTAVGQAVDGSAVLGPNNTILYTPNSTFSGSDSFTYTVSDGLGGTSTGTVTATVGVAANEVDVLVPLNAYQMPIDVLDSVAAASYGTPTVTAVTQSANGSAGINSDNTLWYTPHPGFTGTDTFTYTVVDGLGGISTANVALSVGPVEPDLYVDTAAGTNSVIDVIDNVPGAGGAGVAITSYNQPTSGVVTLSGNNLNYAPNPNFTGSDSFTYTVSAGGVPVTGNVYVTVGLNAANIAVGTAENTPVNVDVPANVTAASDATLTVTISQQPTSGTVQVNADNTLTYTPNHNSTSNDSFQYTVADGLGGTATATVNVALNPAPTAVSDSATTDINTPVTVDVLANDWSASGTTLTVTAVTQPPHGTVVINPDSSITYMPDGITSGSFTFSYTASDGEGGTASAIATVTVSAANSLQFTTGHTPPTTTTAGSSFTVQLQARDANGNPLSGTVTLTTTDPQVPTLSNVTLDSNGNGSFTCALKTVAGGPWTVSATLGSVTLTSQPISVVASSVAQLAFAEQPVKTPTGVTMPAVQVQVQDAYGNLVTTDNSDQVTLGIASGPGSFLSGSTTTVTVQGGVATFSNLTLVSPGTYRLSESVSGIHTAPNSNYFTITPLQVLPYSLLGNSTGFTVRLNGPYLINTTTPTTYTGGPLGSPLPSVILTTDPGDLSNISAYVPGSLTFNATQNPVLNTITFVTTDPSDESNGQPILPDGSYGAVLRSSMISNGLQAAHSGGGYLDGLDAGYPGSWDYTGRFTVTSAGLMITTTTLPNWTAHVGFNQTIATSGGSGTATFTATGTLPGGLFLSSTGVLSGTPYGPGTFGFTITATDTHGNMARASYTIIINPPVSITTTSLPPYFGPATLASFSGGDGSDPSGGVVEDGSGNLYGTTYYGGLYGDGTVFELPYNSTVGTYGSPVTLVDFDGSNGANPYGNLVYDGSHLIGATASGTAFEVQTDGSNFITLAGVGGSSYSGLTLGLYGNLLGTTINGGDEQYGSVFELIASQGYECVTLGTFTGDNGAVPMGSLAVDSNGDVFGTTEVGGPYQGSGMGPYPGGYGVVFEIPCTNPYNQVPSYGSLQDVASFDYNNTGGNPLGGLVADSNGNLFGTTSTSPVAGGTVFEITTGSGSITTLAMFPYNTTPESPLVIDKNGNLYGTTYDGNTWGTIFEVSGGTITTLGTFSAGSGSGSGTEGGLYGYYPVAGVFLDNHGNLFGVAGYGGYNGDGTVYALTPGGYNQTLQAFGGTGSLTFTTTAGTLPPGLALSNTGVLSGTPTASGSYTFTVTVTDALGASAQLTYTIYVTLP